MKVVLISGSLRSASTNSAVLRTAAAVAPDGVETELYEGMGDLPHFNPDDDPDGGTPPSAVADLRARLATADAVLFCTPEYAGALPGSFKNLLDWTVGGGETYRMPVGWINVAGPASPSGGADAHASLRKVLGYTHSDIVEDAAVHLPVGRGDVGDDGLVADPEIRARIAAVLAALRDYFSAAGQTIR
jgi:chromate reductase, NAD(P)H dehydrogenase (quinone)